jgi:hypothetical protein
MLCCHAHSAPTARDIRGLRARQCTDRMEMGRRAWSDALFGSPRAGGYEDGAVGGLFGHYDSRESATCLIASSARTPAAWAIGSAVSSISDCQPNIGRVDYQHWRSRAGKHSPRSTAPIGSRAAPLSRRKAHRLGQRDKLRAYRSPSRRAYARGCSDGSPRQSCTGERARHVQRSSDFYCEPARRARAAQSAAPAPKTIIAIARLLSARIATTRALDARVTTPVTKERP